MLNNKQNGFFYLWLIGFLLTIPAVTHAETKHPLTPFSAQYHVKKFGLKIGEMETQLILQENGTYLFTSHSRTTGMVSIFREDDVTEKTVLQWRNGRIQPLEYSFTQTGKKSREISVKFNWQEKIYTKNDAGHVVSLPLEPDVLDRMSYQLAIMYDLNINKRPLTYLIVERKGIIPLDFEITGEERIESPLGPFKTTVVKKTHQNNKRQTTLWCAQDLAYFPIRIMHIEKDGGRFFAELQKLEGIPLKSVTRLSN